ncbi:MAG: DUF6308 family protein [Candidatus Limnocylindrales bacterium]
MQLATYTGIIIDGAEERVLRFLATEWRYYDGIEDDEPNTITVLDILAPVMVNAYMGTGADQLRGIHLGLVAECEPVLAQIPVGADLRSFDPDFSIIRQLLHAAVSVRGVLLPVATKVLFRKRRQLIPMLDNVVIGYYLDATGSRNLLDRTQDKRHAADVAVHVLKAFREDLVGCYAQLADMSAAATRAGHPISPLRLLEFLVWSETEPRAYYRRPHD